MDSLHSIGFYVSSALSVSGAMGAALLPGRGARGVALAVSGLGVAGIYASLSAGFAAVVGLVCYAGCALLLASPRYRRHDYAVGDAWRQLGAIGAAALLAALGYSAFRGDFANGTFRGGWFGSVAIGRLLFAHDALVTEAVAALVFVTLVGATAAWRLRDRSR